jgi:integrase/recombinase XerC
MEPFGAAMTAGGLWDQHVAAHLAYLRMTGMSARTIYQRNRSLIRLAMVVPPPIIEATSLMLSEWRAGLHCGEEAVKHYVGDARQFYRWAIDQGLRDDNPAEKLPVPRIGRRLPRPISEDHLFAALVSAPVRVRPWLVLAGWAGLRAKEIAFLRRQHVLETAAPPVILIVHDATKGRHERIVPMSKFVLEELLAYGLPKNGWVFRRGDGRPGPNTPHLVSTLANRHLHNCGIQATLHQLRHRFGTMTYRTRHDLRLVQELMGHRDPSTTAGYAAYDQADAARVVAELPAPRWLKAVR